MFRPGLGVCRVQGLRFRVGLGVRGVLGSSWDLASTVLSTSTRGIFKI